MISRSRALIAVAACLTAGIAIYLGTRNTSQATYRETPVQRGRIDLTVLATGTVQPENRLEIKPPIPGRVEEVLVTEGKRVRKGQVLAWMSSTERAALLDAARAQGPDEVKKWEENYRPTPILAPLNGMIIARKVEPGQSFTSTDAILVMSNRLTVKAQVDETDISQVRLKQPSEIVLDAYPEQKIEATVDQIAFEAKTVNNVTTYVVDVLPKSAPGFMRSGMTANVTFQVASHVDVLWLPTSAVRTQEGRSSVLVKKSAKSSKPEEPEIREIQVGASDGKRVEIKSGLQEGDIVLSAELRGKAPKDRDARRGSNPFNPMGGIRPPRGVR